MRLKSIYFLGLMILIVLTQCEKNQKTETKPNFIVFIADDVSWDDLSVYGNEFVQTPNIDSLSSDQRSHQTIMYLKVFFKFFQSLIYGRKHLVLIDFITGIGILYEALHFTNNGIEF